MLRLPKQFKNRDCFIDLLMHDMHIFGLWMDLWYIGHRGVSESVLYFKMFIHISHKYVKL